MIDYLVNIKFENVDCIYYHLTYNKNEKGRKKEKKLEYIN